jgi:peptidoglycan-N-acetylglucosamine deacetylase
VDKGNRWLATPFLRASAGLHALALGGVCVAPRIWPLALTGLVANHLAIGAAGLLPRCAWLGPNFTRLPAAAGGEMVALTFDDGPHPDVTPAVLELLAQARVRATFFCVGRKAEAHPDLISAIRAAGHCVANHSYTHPNSFALRGPRGMARELERAQAAIERAGGGRPRHFRPPAGIQNPWLAAALANAGLTLVSWTRRGFDTVTRDAGRVAARLLRGLRAGDILLMHDGSSAQDRTGRPVVLEALPRVLDALTRRGLRSEGLDVGLAYGAGVRS